MTLKATDNHYGRLSWRQLDFLLKCSGVLGHT